MQKHTKYLPIKEKNTLLKTIADRSIHINEGNRETCKLFLQLMGYFENGSTVGSNSHHF
jgi:hypothetical protein